MAVIRLGNGGTAQVRVGVLQGVGPTGPKGPKGDRGEPGPVGEQGITGPAGSLSELLSVATASPQAITAGQSITVAFASVERDDFGVFTSSTVLTPPEAGGVYVLNVFVQFDKPANDGNGRRYVQIFEDPSFGPDVLLAAAGGAASPDGATYLNATAVIEAKDGCTYKVIAGSTDDIVVSLAAGRISANRIGAGEQGPAGPAGPAGPVGPQGPSGAKGDAGNASSGYPTYEDLRP